MDKRRGTADRPSHPARQIGRRALPWVGMVLASSLGRAPEAGSLTKAGRSTIIGG